MTTPGARSAGAAPFFMDRARGQRRAGAGYCGTGAWRSDGGVVCPVLVPARSET